MCICSICLCSCLLVFGFSCFLFNFLMSFVANALSYIESPTVVCFSTVVSLFGSELSGQGEFQRISSDSCVR